MAVTIKHAKTDTISDWTQSDLDAQIALGNYPPGTVLADIVLPSDWNDDHTFTGTLGVSNGGTGATTLTGYVKGNATSAFTASSTIPNTDISGLGTMSTQNANSVSITGGSISGTTVSGYIPSTEKGVALGVATLDAGGKVPLSQIPALGDLNYQGTWNANANSPTLTSSVGTKGYYYVVDVAGSTNLNGITDWKVGDWAVFNGSIWQKIDNTDAVTSVNGYTGTVVLTYTDVGAAPATSGTSILYGNGSGGFSNVTVGSGLSFATGTLSATGGTGDVVGPSSSTDNAIARFDSTTGKLIQNSVVTVSDTGDIAGATTITDINYVDFNTGYSTTLTAGQLGWDGNNTLALGMAGGNVIQHIGEDLYFYCKATSAITKGEVVMFTGAVGASGVPTGAPATGITDGTYIMGIAAESIALNGFGLVQAFGELRNVNTTGYADGDILWYDPSVAGGLTKTKPSAPNVKAQMAAVINGGSSGGGTILIRIDPGSQLGGTDSNVQITSASNGQLLSYDGVAGYWKNTSLTAGTGISISSIAGVVTVTNSAPDQTVSITGSGGAVVTGTYPNFTITTPSGTVTSVTGTAPIASTGGATPAISISQATTSTNGYLSSTDWNTFNGKATLPSQATHAGQYLKTDGSTTSWSALPSSLLILLHNGSSTASVSVANGVLPILNHSGATINVAVS